MLFTPWITYYRNIPPCFQHYEALSHKNVPSTSRLKSDTEYSSLLRQQVLRNVEDQGI